MYKAKITTVGNSAGIVLPRSALAHLRLQKGDTVLVRETAEGLEMIPYEAEVAEQIEAANHLMKKHAKLLRGLARR